MGQKRILIYTESFLPSVGGLENNTLLLCTTLHQLGHHVTLLTPQKNALQQSHFKVIETKIFWSFFKAVISHDLVIVNGGVSFKIIIPAIICFKRYLIIYQMATLYKNIHHGQLHVKFGNFLRYVLAKKSKLNVGVSQYSHQELEKTFGSQKSGLLINPADPAFETLTPQSKTPLKPFVCLMAGRLIEGKGVNLLLQSIKELNVAGYAIHLHFIGDGPAKVSILAQQNECIFFHEAMTKLELAKWIKKSHLTIIPSTTHIEGSPLILAESLCLGTPVLVSSQPAMSFAIQHKSLIFEIGNISSLKAKIIQLMDENYYVEILNHCHQIANDFSYHRYAQKLQHIITNV